MVVRVERKLLALPVAAAVVALVGAAPASAKPADAVLPGPSGTKVVVERDPLRISFVDAAGRAVLRQAQPAGGFGIVPPIAGVQYGTLSPPPPAVYSPFPFLVGSHDVSQTPAGQWQGTLQQVSERGTVYSA